MLNAIKSEFMTKKKKIKKRDELRHKLDEALKDDVITRTEYDLIWDLTTELNIYLAEIYFKRAFHDGLWRLNRA